MSDPTFTPGMWTASWNNDRTWVGVDCGDAEDLHRAEVCTICQESIEIDNEDDAWLRALADARLIAAAPDLLSALKTIKQIVEEHTVRGSVCTPEVVEFLDAFLSKGQGAQAMARAEGRSQ